MRVVVAPDKFKGSLTAAQVADAIARGLLAVIPDCEIVRVPVADGGDGTVDAAVAAGFERVLVTATGPTGRSVETSYARRGDTAVVELADACGLARLPDGPDPMGATSRGLGDVMQAALAAGVRHLVVGIGGSASTDGGRGVLDSLGTTSLDGVDAVVACDVDNPLLGPTGAAAVYAPQKGATPAQVDLLEQRLTEWTATLGADFAETPGSGAAGGVGFALLHLGATLRPGADLVLGLLGFDAALAGAELVITGEGAMDAQTLAGKAPAGVAARACRAGVPVVAVAGRCDLSEDQLSALGIGAVFPLSALEDDLARAIRNAAALVERQGRAIARQLVPARGPAATR